MSEEIGLKALFIEMKRLRKCQGITQEELAEELGINYKYLQDIENGRSLPGTKLFLYLVKKFDISLDYYLDLSRTEFNAEQLALTNRISNCTHEEVVAINAVLDVYDIKR